VVRGTPQAMAELLSKTRTGTVINTAYIERLNATFRSALAPLARRGRAIAHLATTLTAGMDLVGCAYNFCWCHRSLRLPAAQGSARLWREAHTGPGRRLNRPPLDHGRAPALPGASATLGAAQAARASTRMESTTAHGRGDVITVKCGAT